ncbi:hypothetical protein SteCoe_32008 [Stentor coeruleus]|uniref:IBB domain-containing protein n=1 Tax=Stentor coeruleus TaxID=5963 RepID=A0A1R2AZZ3_9CILI|nr:hypothetical protein SteCoe_32008 [Stentor coeruleus]
MERVIKRKSNFQKLNIQKISQDRQEFAVELRKSKRKDLLQKYRFPSIPTSDTVMGIPESFQSNSYEAFNLDPFTLIQALHNSECILDYTSILQKISIQISDNQILIEEYVKLGLIEIIIPHINLHDNLILKNITYLIICSISSDSSYCYRQLFKYDIISLIFYELETKNSEVFNTLFLILGNFMAESSDAFQLILDKNFFLVALKCVMKNKNSEILKVVSWSLKNATFYDYLIENEHLDTFIKLAFEILEYDSFEIKSFILQSITRLIRRDNKKIDFIIHSQFLFRVFELWHLKPLCNDILKLCANVCSGKNTHIQVLIDLGYLNLLEEFLRSESNNDEIFFVFFSLSNIASGSFSQINSLEKHTIFEMSLDGIFCLDERIQSEATYYVRNYTVKGKREEVEKLFSKHFLKKITQGFKFAKSDDAVMNLLKAYEMIARVADKSALLAEDCQYVLYSLQKNSNADIHRKSNEILEKYYSLI